MSTTQQTSNFIRRFDSIWSQARRVQLSQALCWAILTLVAGIACLAAIDYWLELPRPLRIAGMAVVGVVSATVAVALAVFSVRRWQRNATAATIEEFFPQLGQRIRTTVQYGELSNHEMQEAGVATALVAALEDDTTRVAQPLPLDAVIPWKSLAFASLLAAVVGLGFAGAAAFDWQWRAAAKRTFLAEEPYTTIVVKPGDTSVREGHSITAEILVEGRVGSHMSFWTRRADEEASEWNEEVFSTESATSAGERQVAFDVPLERIRHPLEYRVTAGSAESETYSIKVLYPLKIARVQATVQPPESTGLDETTIEGDSITALVGSHVKLQVELDRQPDTAWIEMKDISRRNKDGQLASEQLPLVIEGTKLTTEFDVTEDKTFAVVAKSADGMELPENRRSIRARQDEPPQVWFDSPAEALEVHTLAEIAMRIRTSDDFGLSRAGIVFEVNNEEEIPLLTEEFQAAVAELENANSKEKLSPSTRSTLEKILPLEHFGLTQQDSVMYYAFAEDILPGSPQRTETDLRFVDIRPFLRQYRVLPDADGMNMNRGPALKTLEELIARQRYALNRTVQLGRKFERTGQADLSAFDALLKFEGELAQSTRELAEGLEARGIDETELLYQAESSMLTAADSLSAGSYDTANLQMRDALKYLIEGRNRLQLIFSKNPNREQLAALRAFDRMQRQKLRRPKSDEEAAREIAERLEELADQEDFVYQALASIIDPTAKGTMNGGSGGNPDEKAEENKPEQPRMDAPNAEGQSREAAEKPPAETDEKKPMQQGAGQSDQPAEAEGGDENQADEGMPTPQELEDRQLDIAAEAREIEKALEKLPKATDLAKQRMAAAASKSEEAAAALGKGAPQEAQTASGAARDQLRELSEQVRAILAEEQADRIAAAQQMAAQLAQMEQDFADRLAQNQGEGGMEQQPPTKPEPNKPGIGTQQQQGDNGQMPGLGRTAREIAEKAETLADVLGASAKATAPEEQAAARKVEELIESLELKGLTERIAELPDQIAGGQLQDARATAVDGAERMEAAAEQLSVMHRIIVAPRVDELAKLEEKLTALDEQLEELNTDTKITGWHMEADELLADLEEAGIDKELRQEFVEELKKGGWGDGLRRREWGWGRTERGYYAPPSPYRVMLSRLSTSVRLRMQELMLGDLIATGDEPIPPQYQELVDRYYQALASAGKDRTLVTPAAESKE